jgi:hypothetical protein
MYTQQLGHLVDSLLSRHPMVVIPGVGALVREPKQAEIDSARSRILPPSEELIFSPRLLHNDGLLINAVAEKWGFGLSAADDWLTDAVSEFRFMLAAGHRVFWPNVGSLSLSSDGRIHFVVDKNRAVSPQFFGLRPLQANEVSVQTPLSQRAAATVRQLPLRKVAGYAAAAAVMGLIAWLPFQQGVVDGGQNLMAEMGLVPHAQHSVYAPREFRPVQFTTDISPAEPKNIGLVPLNDEKQNITWEEADAPSTYHVIAASFPTIKEAEAFLEKLQQRGFQAEFTAGPNDLFSVSYGRYASIATAESMLASVRLSNPNAAILPAH